jgi:hypothetical protein
MATEVIEVIETAVEVVEVLTQGPQGPQGSAASVVYGTTAGTATQGNDSRIPTQALNPANAPTFTGLTINGVNDGTRSVNASGKMFFGSVNGNTGMLSEAQNSFVYDAYVWTGLNTSVNGYRPLVICASNTPQLSIHPNNKVGIGVAIPQSQLDVSGDITATSTVSIKNGTGQLAGASIFYNEGDEDKYIDLFATRAGTVGNSIVLVLDGTSSIQTIVNTWNTNNPNNTIQLVENGTAVLSSQTVTFSGGTDPLKSTIDVVNLSANRTHSLPDASGTLALASQATDYEVTDATKGVIMKSPNGSRWRLTIDNSGSLIRTIVMLVFLLSFICGSQAQVRDLVYGTNNVVIGPTNTNALSFTNRINLTNTVNFGGGYWANNGDIYTTNVIAADGGFNGSLIGTVRIADGTGSNAFTFENLVDASFVRTNLGLGWSALTNANASTSLLGYTNNVVVGPTNTNALAFTNSVAFSNPISFGTNAATTRTNLGVTVASNLPYPYSGSAATNSLLVANGSGSSVFVSALPSLSISSGLFLVVSNGGMMAGGSAFAVNGTSGYAGLWNLGQFGWSSSGSVTTNITLDTVLLRDSANTLASRNGTNPQTYNVYGSYTNSTNYRRLSVGMSNSGIAYIRPEQAGPLTNASNFIYISGLPTNSAGLPSGVLYNLGGAVMVTP